MSVSEIKHPSAFLPIAMSLGALAAVLCQLAISGIARQSDEGATAHIWQLLMAGQIPVVAFHAIKWLPRHPKAAKWTLGVQLVSALAALTPVYWLGW